MTPLESIGWAEVAYRALNLSQRAPAKVLARLVAEAPRPVSRDALCIDSQIGEPASPKSLSVYLSVLENALNDLGFSGALLRARDRLALTQDGAKQIDAFVRSRV